MSGFLTDAGLAAMAVATPASPLSVKYMAFDDGDGTPTQSMTALFHEVYRAEIPNPIKDPDNDKNLIFTGFIPSSVGGWTIKGVGLLGNSGTLLAYLRLGESVVKPAPSSALKMEMTQDFILGLTNTSQTDLIVSDSIKFDHSALTGRTSADCHPMTAITGLQDKIDDMVSVSQTQVIGGNKRFEYMASFKQIASWWDGSTVTFGNNWMTLDATDYPNSAGKISVKLNGVTSALEITEGTISGNGSGLTTLNGSNISSGTVPAARLPDASTSTKGAVPLATNAETQTGSNTTKAITPSAFNASSFGWGQTTQNVTASRASDVTYTNNTGRPIEVTISIGNSSSDQYITINRDGVALIDNLNFDQSGAVSAFALSFTVKVGGSWSYSRVGDGVIRIIELR